MVVPDKEAEQKYKSIVIQYPIRLNAMAIDPSKIASDYKMVYTPGEVVFSTKLSFEVKVEIINNKGEISIEGEKTGKDSIIMHTCMILKKALKIKTGFLVNVKKYHIYSHCGFGSSGSLQAAVACAINELYGKPYSDEKLIKFLARNYGEEISGNSEQLNPVQCIGGSAAAGLCNAGVLVLAGENTVIGKGKIDSKYEVIIGVPKDYEIVDSVNQFDKEKECLEVFQKCGDKYRDKIAYNILHKFMPAMVNANLEQMGDIICDYRYNMGSIKNCSYTYPALEKIMENLLPLKTNKIVDVLSISSVGPSVFAITHMNNSKQCIAKFKEEGLDTIKTKINNRKYRILDKK